MLSHSCCCCCLHPFRIGFVTFADTETAEKVLNMPMDELVLDTRLAVRLICCDTRLYYTFPFKYMCMYHTACALQWL